jgi:hypothetical protein
MRWLLAIAVFVLADSNLRAQTVQTTVPLQQFGSTFFEQQAVQWSVQGPNFFAQSGAPAVAPFGNPSAVSNAGTRVGVGRTNGRVRGSLGLSLAQGSRRTISSGSASVTTLNGQPGSISSQTLRPFVTGLSPVLAGNSFGAPATQNASRQLFAAGQQTQAAVLRSRFAANQMAQQRRAEQAFERGLRAENAGDLRQARANYRNALAADRGPLRIQILRRLKANGW